MPELWRLPAVELLDLLDRREVSSRELVAAHLARIDAVDGAVNAVVARDDDRALAAADAHDRHRVAGEVQGPLAGLPMTIKDTFETAGLATTAGAATFAHHVPDRDAVTVARLREAGAVIIGKTNVPAFADDVQTFNDLFGTTHNPWDLARSPGGSSGGAAAALATGMTPLELGSDLAGSIRTPSSWCGVCGHKPTYGVVPMQGHIPGPPGQRSVADVGVAGPLARTVTDLELAFGVLAGPGAREGRAWSLDLPAPRVQHVAGLRAAAWLDDPTCPTGKAVRGVLDGTVEVLAGAGAEVAEARPDLDVAAHFERAMALTTAVSAAGLPRSEREALARLVDEAEEASDVQRSGAADPAMLRVARWVTQGHVDWLRSNERRLRALDAFEAFFDEGWDVLLTPVTPVPAIPHDQEGSLHLRTIEVDGDRRPYPDLLFWPVLSGSVYLPSTVVPVGLTGDGLPVGIQVIGPSYGDRTTLAVAALIEQLVEPVGLADPGG